MASIIAFSAFGRLPMRPVTDPDLDSVLAESGPGQVSILYLWGSRCADCEAVRAALRSTPESFLWPGVRWLESDLRDDLSLATRFGLLGIPAFLIFAGRRPRGRITGWPGVPTFPRLVGEQLRRLH